jgi:nicotinamide-nucleotide amidase
VNCPHVQCLLEDKLKVLNPNGWIWKKEIMKIGIISTGEELMRGVISDTNASWMCSRLDEHDYSVRRITVVGDDLELLTATFKQAFDSQDLVVVSGGLGPTVDDLTAQAAAKAMGCVLVQNEEAVKQITTVFEKFKFPMAEINLKQADLPEGCSVLENKRGTAPGFALNTNQGRAVFLPGPPPELQPMFETFVLEELLLHKTPKHRASFRCMGVGESNLQEKIEPITEKFPDLKLSFRVTFPEISLTLIAPNEASLSSARSEVRTLLGRTIIAEKEIGLPQAFGEALRQRGLTIATAESCTGGLIGHAITEVPGSSQYYLGGVVAYENNIKTGMLGVDRDILQSHGAVSEPVVRAMADGVRQAMGADMGLATSGIAGPGGGTPEKPVGLVHMAVSLNGRTDHMKREFGFFGRSQVKRIAAWMVMKMALDAIVED